MTEESTATADCWNVLVVAGSANIVVALGRLSDERAQADAHRTGLIDTIGRDCVFMSVEEAVRRLGPNVGLTKQT